MKFITVSFSDRGGCVGNDQPAAIARSSFSCLSDCTAAYDWVLTSVHPSDSNAERILGEDFQSHCRACENLT
jgi:hypothetical protein